MILDSKAASQVTLWLMLLSIQLAGTSTLFKMPAHNLLEHMILHYTLAWILSWDVRFIQCEKELLVKTV